MGCRSRRTNSSLPSREQETTGPFVRGLSQSKTDGSTFRKRMQRRSRRACYPPADCPSATGNARRVAIGEHWSMSGEAAESLRLWPTLPDAIRRAMLVLIG
jgi:hypothetical protein